MSRRQAVQAAQLVDDARRGDREQPGIGPVGVRVAGPSGVPNLAPLPNIGIDVQNAGAVHIEKSSIGNFTQDTSACVKLDTAKVVVGWRMPATQSSRREPSHQARAMPS